MEVVSSWQWFAEYLRDQGFSVSGILLIFMVGWSLVRGNLRERDFTKREAQLTQGQSAFIHQVSEEIVRMNERLNECERERDMAEGQKFALEIQNRDLDYWKALCLDSCPNYEEVHQKGFMRWKGKSN